MFNLLLLDTNLFGSFGIDVVISMGTALVSLIGGYIIIRERILKTEMKISTMTDYIDRKNEVINNKIGELVQDINEFKDLNKEITKSLGDNTIAIRELKVVLEMLKEQMGVKAMRKLNQGAESD